MTAHDTLAMVTTYPPTRCGIASFSTSLAQAMRGQGQAVDVMRVLQTGDSASHDPVVKLEFDPGSEESLSEAISLIDTYESAVVQHEFGIFGPDDGGAVVEMVDGISTTVLVTLHTVPLHPTDRQSRILQQLSRASDAVIVPSRAAKRALSSLYDVPPARVTVVPHGSHWSPTRPGAGKRKRLMTWGLLGPGKGIERAIAAVANIADDRPIYRVVGEIHPNVARREGTRYRDQLLELIASHQLEDHVILDDGYKDEGDLYAMVADSDLVVVPYDNDEQISSGVLTEALSAGKPVIATRFPHAEELLSSGSGIVVEHEDMEGLSKAIRVLLEDDIAYHRASAEARSVSRAFAWPTVARSYLDVIDQLIESERVG